MWRRRLAVHGADPRRNRTEIAAALDGMAEKRLGHRAAADIAGANEQNGFHPARRFKVIRETASRQSEIKPCDWRITASALIKSTARASVGSWM